VFQVTLSGLAFGNGAYAASAASVFSNYYAFQARRGGVLSVATCVCMQAFL